jgi:hypothetical protein
MKSWKSKHKHVNKEIFFVISQFLLLRRISALTYFFFLFVHIIKFLISLLYTQMHLYLLIRITK